MIKRPVDVRDEIELWISGEGQIRLLRVGHLEHGAGHVNKDACRPLGGLHHSEGIATQHGCPFLWCLLREQVLKRLNG